MPKEKRGTKEGESGMEFGTRGTSKVSGEAERRGV
jgi:hypothetical protein